MSKRFNLSTIICRALCLLAVTFVLNIQTATADKKFIVVDDWSVDKLCNHPAEVCCIGSNCPTFSTSTCTSPAGNQVSALCSASPAPGYVWSGGAPCKIVGSFRDIVIQSKTGCTSNPNSSMATARVNSSCGHVVVQGNLISGESQTVSSGSLVWDYGNLPKTLTNVDSNGLSANTLVSKLGTEILIGSGPFTIPVCQKNNTGDSPTELEVTFYFADNTSYTVTKVQEPKLSLTTACGSADADLSMGCPMYNYIKLDIPAQHQGKKLGAVKIGFKEARKLFIGRLGFACTADAVDTNGMPFGERVYSCTQTIPACVVPTPTPTPPSVSCTEKDVMPLLLDLDGNALKLKNSIAKSVKIAKTAKVITAKQASSFNNQADSLYHGIWGTIWTIPPKVKLCTGGSSCQVVSYTATIASYEKDFAAMRSLITTLSSKMIKSKNTTVKKRGQALKKESETADKDSKAQVSSLPTESKVCQ